MHIHTYNICAVDTEALLGFIYRNVHNKFHLGLYTYNMYIYIYHLSIYICIYINYI